MAHKVDPKVMAALWDHAKGAITNAVRMFVDAGIKSRRGEKKKDAEELVWTEVAKSAFASGVDLGYDMGCTVSLPEATRPHGTKYETKFEPPGSLIGGWHIHRTDQVPDGETTYILAQGLDEDEAKACLTALTALVKPEGK